MIELEARILADPDDVDAHLVYADWLQAQDDPRGELIALQIQIATTPTDALRARERQLLRKHRTAWLGELGQLSTRDFDVTWRYGFVRGVRIGPPLDARATTELDVAHTIGEVTRMPGVEHVRELTVGAIEHNGYPTTWAAAVAGIARHGVPPSLAKLALRRGEYWDFDDTTLGDLSPAYPRLGRLRELTIELGAAELGEIVLPELRSIELVIPQMTRENIASLRAASCPELARMSLCLGAATDDAIAFEDLRWVLAGENLANLRHLGLTSTRLSDALALGLCGSRVLRQLETLDLSLGTLGEAGARAILANLPLFRHLRTLDLSHAYLDDRVRALLAQVVTPQIILDDPQSPDDDIRRPAVR